jgi:hypothetical protein
MLSVLSVIINGEQNKKDIFAAPDAKDISEG